MKIFIALLRGINVGGHKKVPMAELRQLLSDCGYDDVKTYIQSGNVILKSRENNNQEIEESIKNAISDTFGFEVSVLVRTRDQLQKIFDNCPFPEDKKKRSYFVLLQSTPNTDLVKIASQKTYEDEDYFILNDCIYYHGVKGFGQAKFNPNFFERKLKTTATARNYNTMVKLLSLSSESN